jgi:hypothetical protein
MTAVDLEIVVLGQGDLRFTAHAAGDGTKEPGYGIYSFCPAFTHLMLRCALRQQDAFLVKLLHRPAQCSPAPP